MKNSDCSPQLFFKNRECDAKANPLLIILAAVVCMMVFPAITSVVEASGQSVSQPERTKAWRPPVAQPVTPKPMVSPQRAEQIAEKWGVELVSLRLTAAGYMIDFRFRVLDTEKANTFFDHRVKPLLVVERSNAKLPVPMAAKVGAFRTTNRGKNIKRDRTYYMVFANPDAHVKSGDKVTMLIGEFKAEHLAVN